jgi:GNAT superfamily N-acetyltransferase
MLEYIPYILFIIILLIFLVHAYIRIKFGFWALQPVFHIYDIGYFFYKPGILDYDLPEKNKYTNFKNIETIIQSQVTKGKWKKLVNFIQLYYLKNKENTFLPKEENVIPYFNGHNAKSFITFYNEDYLLYDLKKSTTITNNKIISIITSRPVHIQINNGDKDAIFDAYYVDYLCVDKAYRKKGIAPQMIQTHHYNQRHLNTNIYVSIFKREEELTGIVPLCVYSTYGFSVMKWAKPPDLHGAYKLLEITLHNFHFLQDFIKNQNKNFDILIISEITNIIELLKTKNIFIYIILVDDNIIAAYFYRKTCVFIEKDMEVLTCIASINDCENNELFIQGFKISFWKISALNYFGFCAIENISHNDIIIENVKIKTKPTIISPTAYFFYNFVYSTFNSKKVFILN